MFAFPEASQKMGKVDLRWPLVTLTLISPFRARAALKITIYRFLATLCPFRDPTGAGFNPFVRGVFKKFAAQPRRKTNFRTQRGVRDVTLLKRPLTQPLANRSSCFAQAVGCCKNVCYFCRTQRRSAGSRDSIRSVTEKCHKGYPRILVGNTGGMLSSL